MKTESTVKTGGTVNILEKLGKLSMERAKKAKSHIPEEEMRKKAFSLIGGGDAFYKALKREGLSVISEIKKASPSKGIIDEVFDYKKIAEEYINGNADAISVLTEPDYFLGSDEIFREVRKRTNIAMIRKDFTVDEYQIYESKVMGADAILLIAALLEKEKLRHFLRISREAGLAALVETHTENEIETALDVGAEIIGVNNRNLVDFSVDFSLALRYREMIPRDKIFVAESGVSCLEDVYFLRKIGADAVLVGEFLMKSSDKSGMLGKMKKECLQSENAS